MLTVILIIAGLNILFLTFRFFAYVVRISSPNYSQYLADISNSGLLSIQVVASVLILVSALVILIGHTFQYFNEGMILKNNFRSVRIFPSHQMKISYEKVNGIFSRALEISSVVNDVEIKNKDLQVHVTMTENLFLDKRLILEKSLRIMRFTMEKIFSNFPNIKSYTVYTFISEKSDNMLQLKAKRLVIKLKVSDINTEKLRVKSMNQCYELLKTVDSFWLSADFSAEYDAGSRGCWTRTHSNSP